MTGESLCQGECVGAGRRLPNSSETGAPAAAWRYKLRTLGGGLSFGTPRSFEIVDADLAFDDSGDTAGRDAEDRDTSGEQRLGELDFLRLGYVRQIGFFLGAANLQKHRFRNRRSGRSGLGNRGFFLGAFLGRWWLLSGWSFVVGGYPSGIWHTNTFRLLIGETVSRRSHGRRSYRSRIRMKDWKAAADIG
jgi:hypothetical protein